MSALDVLSKELDEKHVENISKFVADVRCGKLEGSNNIAVATVALLERVISDAKNANALELSIVVREVGRRLTRALPQHLVPGNMARRVLRAIRDEQRHSADQSSGGGESLQRLVRGDGGRRGTIGNKTHDLREPLREHIAELRLELESCSTSISSSWREHVHADALLLAAGGSQLLERFLKQAAHRPYRLILAEGATPKESHSMAARLSALGVPVTVVSNAAVAGLMARVDKVVLSASALLAGGGALAPAGSASVATAAHYYRVPVIMLAPLYKLSPLHACDPHQFAALAAPHRAMPYTNASACICRVVTPRYDLVPPDHITLFATNLGGHSPSYIYRLLSELYDQKDYQL